MPLYIRIYQHRRDIVGAFGRKDVRHTERRPTVGRRSLGIKRKLLQGGTVLSAWHCTGHRSWPCGPCAPMWLSFRCFLCYFCLDISDILLMALPSQPPRPLDPWIYKQIVGGDWERGRGRDAVDSVGSPEIPKPRAKLKPLLVKQRK